MTSAFYCIIIHMKALLCRQHYYLWVRKLFLFGHDFASARVTYLKMKSPYQKWHSAVGLYIYHVIFLILHSFSEMTSYLFQVFVEKIPDDYIHPQGRWVFQAPLRQLWRELQGKRKQDTLNSFGFVCNFQVGPQVLPKRGLSAHLDPTCWDFPLTSHSPCEWLIVQGLQEAFRFSSVWHAVGGYLCIKARPVPPQWKIPFSTSISDLLCVIVSGYFTWQRHKVRNTVVCFVLSYRVSTITFSIIFFLFSPLICKLFFLPNTDWLKYTPTYIYQKKPETCSECLKPPRNVYGIQ